MGDVSWELENEQSPGGGRDEVMPRLHTTPEEVSGVEVACGWRGHGGGVLELPWGPESGSGDGAGEAGTGCQVGLQDRAPATTLSPPPRPLPGGSSSGSWDCRRKEDRGVLTLTRVAPAP